MMVPSDHDHKGSMNNNSKDGAKQAQPQAQLSSKFFHKSQISQNKANDEKKKTLRFIIFLF
jgi:hypothetical protein